MLDMVMETEEHEVYTADSIYYELIDLLQDIRLVQGPLAVTGTLNNHKDLRRLLIERQKLKINILENAYAECYNKPGESNNNSKET